MIQQENIQDNVLLKKEVGRCLEELSVQCSSSGVCLAEGFSRFHKEALTLQIFLAKRAVEAL